MYVFLVGPEEQPFEFPDSLITSNRKLLSALPNFRLRRSRVRNKRTGEVTTKRYYYLPSLIPYEFEQFELFLYGGDFLWDDKIASLFSVLGFSNLHGYPLDYWKIKLQDNWIRDNFHSLKLYDSRVRDPPLLIERGPYVGLQRMDDYFQTGIPVSFEKSQGIDFFRKLGEEWHLPLGEERMVVAGGSLLTYLMGAPRKPNDVDLFFTTKDRQVASETILETLDNFPGIENLLLNGVTDVERGYQAFAEAGNLMEIIQEIHEDIEPNPEVRELYPVSSGLVNKRVAELIREFDMDANVFTHLSKVVVSENAITLKGKVKLQFILRLYTCPSEVVHGFDLDASGILFDGSNLWATKRAQYAIQRKINYFDFDRVSPSYAYRLAKYASRGFQVWLPGFQEGKVNRDALRSIQVDFMDTNEGLELANRRFFPATLLVQSAPYYIPSRGDALIFRDKDFKDIKRLVERKNPVDLIIFATYFHYLPTMNISDYNREEPVNLEEHTEATVGPGYVILHTNFKEYALNLPREMAEDAELPTRPEWKTQNPMEQLTGTFTPTRVEDIREWYEGAEFYNV